MVALTPDVAAPPKAVETADAILKRLDWHVVRRLDGILQGDYRSLFTGHGFDLAEVREYQPGDDVRYMDWNVTARMDHPYVRQYVEDREISAWFILDLSPSVDFGTAMARKKDLVVDFTAVLARLLTRHGNRVGAVLFSSNVDEVVAPRGGFKQALRMVHQMIRTDHKRTKGKTDLAAVLSRTAETLKRRSLVFIVSDFIAPEGWELPLTNLAQKHEVVAVWLHDPREDEIPPIGPLVLEDAETGEQVYVDTRDKKFQARFKTLVAERRQRLEHTFARHGIDVLNLSTGSDLVHDIARFALLRRDLRRRQGGHRVKVGGGR